MAPRSVIEYFLKFQNQSLLDISQGANHGAPGSIPMAAAAEEALALAKADNDSGAIAVVGGSAIYDVFRPMADRIEVTEIHAEYRGDTFMKPLGSEWQIAGREDHAADGDLPAFSFVTYTRHDDHTAAT